MESKSCIYFCWCSLRLAKVSADGAQICAEGIRGADEGAGGGGRVLAGPAHADHRPRAGWQLNVKRFGSTNTEVSVCKWLAFTLNRAPLKFHYRVTQQVSDLGWVDFDLDVPPILRSCSAYLSPAQAVGESVE